MLRDQETDCGQNVVLRRRDEPSPITGSLGPIADLLGETVWRPADVNRRPGASLSHCLRQSLRKLSAPERLGVTVTSLQDDA